MIGRMRPFYQAHWDISKDIKHVWLLICTYYIAWIFQWILSGEGRGKWWDRQYRVWIPQCAAPLDVTVTYARDSFVDSPSVLRPGWHMQETALWIPRGAFCPLEGGPRHIGTDTLAPVLHQQREYNKVSRLNFVIDQILIFHHNLQINSLKILQCDFLDFFFLFCFS